MSNDNNKRTLEDWAFLIFVVLCAIGCVVIIMFLPYSEALVTEYAVHVVNTLVWRYRLVFPDQLTVLHIMGVATLVGLAILLGLMKHKQQSHRD